MRAWGSSAKAVGQSGHQGGACVTFAVAQCDRAQFSVGQAGDFGGDIGNRGCILVRAGR